MRTTDGLVAPESANRAWKSASKVTTIQPPWRAKSIIFASLAVASPFSLRGRTRPLRHRDGGLWNAGGPDRAAASSGVGKGQDLVVNQSSREGQRLPNIFIL